MIAGVAIAWDDFKMPGNQNAIAQPVLPTVIPGRMPLDLQLDLDKKLSKEASIKDSVHIRDSVRIIEKVKWKTRYKTLAARTAARNAGKHIAAATPDSMPHVPANISAVVREEKATDSVDVSKTPSIQLTVDGQVVYSTNDIHSAEEGQWGFTGPPALGNPVSTPKGTVSLAGAKEYYLVWE